MSGQDASSSESEDDSDDSSSEEEDAQIQASDSGSSPQRVPQSARRSNNGDNPPPYQAGPATWVRRPIIVSEGGHLSDAARAFSTTPGFPALVINHASHAAAHAAALQAMRDEEAVLASRDAAQAVSSGSGDQMQTALDAQRREDPHAIDEESTHRETIPADIASSTRSTSLRQAQELTAPTSALPVEAVPSVEPVPSIDAALFVEAVPSDEAVPVQDAHVEGEDRVARRAARVARREQRAREEEARVEADARYERNRIRRLERRAQLEDEDWAMDGGDVEPVPRERKRQRTSRRQPVDEAPRIKEESPSVFAAAHQLVQVKQEPRSRAQTPEAAQQATSQPEVRVKQEPQSRVSTPNPQHEGAFHPEVHTEQRSPFHGFRSRSESQSSSSDEAEVESQNDEESSSRSSSHEARHQDTSRSEAQTEQRLFQYQLGPNLASRKKRKHARKFAPLIVLYRAAKSRRVKDSEWVVAGHLVHPARYGNLSPHEAAKRFRSVAESANGSVQHITITELVPTGPLTAEQLKSHKQRVRLEKLAPMIALHAASLQRSVADSEWMTVRQQVCPKKYSGKGQTRIVASLRNHAKYAYRAKQQMDSETA